jgi:hypothetical protein
MHIILNAFIYLLKNEQLEYRVKEHLKLKYARTGEGNSSKRPLKRLASKEILALLTVK